MAAKRREAAQCTRWRKLPATSGTVIENNNYLVREHVRPDRKEGFQPWIYRYSAYMLVTVLASACYFNSLSGQLVHDDVFAIKNNRDLRPGSPIAHMFLHDFWGRDLTDNTSHKSYRPLTVLTFRLNYYLHGLEPLGYHLINVLLHSAVTWLFTHICASHVFRNITQATYAGCLFAVHPIHTEAVSGIVGRADVLCCLVVLTSFCVYTKTLDEKNNFYRRQLLLLIATILLAAVAMLCKETGVVVLGICLLCDIMAISVSERSGESDSHQKCTSKRTGFRIAVLFLAIVCLVYFRLWLMGGTLPRFTEQDNPASFSPHWRTRVMTYGYLASYNSWMLLYPSILSYDWQMSSIPLVTAWCDTRNLATAVLFLLLATVIFHIIFHAQDDERRVLSIGVLFLVLPFLPASNVCFPVGFVVAERILYIPSLGYIILVVHGLGVLMRRVPRRRCILIATFGALVFVLTTRTFVRNRVWANRESLFLSGVQTLPQNAKMHYNYANLLKDMGDKDAAVYHYAETIRLWSRHASALNNLGTLTDNNTQAEFFFRQAISVSGGTHAGAHFNLANLYFNHGHKEIGVEYMKAAVLLDPACVDVYSSLLLMLEEAGEYDNADQHYQQLLKRKPNDVRVMEQYAAFLSRIGRYRQSISVYRQILTADPHDHAAMIEAAKLLKAIGKSTEAFGLIDRALRTDQSPPTYDAAGVFYFNMGEHIRAVEIFKQALVQKEENMAVLIHLIQALASSDQYHEAEEYGQRALQQNPGHVTVLQQMSKISGFIGKHREGLKYAEQAFPMTVDNGELSELWLDKGNHHRELKEYQQALEAYTKAVSINPALSEAHLNMGVIHHIKRHFSKARECYNAAQRLDPENVVLMENIRKLDKAI